jgi:hypothetical protein
MKARLHLLVIMLSANDLGYNDAVPARLAALPLEEISHH